MGRSQTVHTTSLRSHDFQLAIAGAAASLEDVLPGFDEHDRLGIVITTDQGARGVAMLVLAAVTGFYDRLRAGGEPFFAYADYFAFHVGARRGDLRQLDVWPPHKEVVVAGDAEAVLRAVNDRGVTRLLVPDGHPGSPALAPETVASARRRILTALAYDGGGRVPRGDIRVSGGAAPARFATQMLQTTGAPAAAVSNEWAQTFRRLDLAEALGLLEATDG